MKISFKECKEWLEGINYSFKFCELLSSVEIWDASIPEYSEAEKEELKKLFKEKKQNILWVDKDLYIEYRKEHKIPKEKFWWYIDKL